MNDLNPISKCEVCESTNLVSVLDLGYHPICDDLKPVDSDLACKSYPIEILFCNNCKTAHQKYQIPKQDLFPKTYHYRARFTKDVLLGMQDLVENCAGYVDSLLGKKVLDIGSNDGSLLNFFKEKGAVCLGVEPTDAAADSHDNLDAIFNEFFDINLAEEIHDKYGPMDVITFTNVFAHIEDLNGLLLALRVVIGEQTHLIVENHYLGKVLEKNQFDTFYHEHPRTYSATSFNFIAEKLGMYIHSIDFPQRYGGNIRVTMSKNPPLNFDQDFQEIFAAEDDYINRFETMNTFIKNWKQTKGLEILELKNQHNVLYAKAFPARAAILFRLLNLDESHIQGVFEQDRSMKVGHFVPGTRVPILADSQMQAIEPPVLINLAWHLKTEIESYLRSTGYAGEIRHIL